MTSGSLVRLARLSLSRDRRGAFFSAFGVAVGVGALVFFVSLGLGVGQVIRERVFPVDANLVEVVPPAVSLGALFGGGKIDQDTVDRLAALPGVRRVYRKMNVRAPAVTRYDGDFFGSRVRMGLEVVAVGVDPGFVSQDVLQGPFEDAGPDQPIPGLAANRLLEIYNKTFAPARKLPQLSPNMVVGFTFPVEFGRSFVAQTEGATRASGKVQIVGTSDRALLAGVTVPLDAAIRINQATGQDAQHFTGVVLEASDPAGVHGLMDAVRGMGLGVDDSERKLAQSAGAAVAVTTSALALLSVLICLLAAVNIAHALSASVRARAREIGVMRAVGASRRDIRWLIFAEAGAVGLFGGLVGTLAAVAVSFGIDVLSARYLPNFPFKPESFFAFPPGLVLGGVGLGLFAALAGAFFPSRRAAAMDPARTLAG